MVVLLSHGQSFLANMKSLLPCGQGFDFKTQIIFFGGIYLLKWWFEQNCTHKLGVFLKIGNHLKNNHQNKND
jgi:hypothetical protein